MGVGKEDQKERVEKSVQQERVNEVRVKRNDNKMIKNR